MSSPPESGLERADAQRLTESPLLFGLYVLIGYVAAVLVAAAIAVVMLTGFDGFFYNSGSFNLDEFVPIYMVACVYTGLSAWPGYGVTVWLALKRIWRFNIGWFALAGGLTSIQAALAFETWLSTPGALLGDSAMTISIICGGVVGGAAYGVLHGRMFPRGG